MINFMYELVLILSFRCCVMMKMSRQWMYEDQRSAQFINGMHSFLQAAEANKRDGFMSCPCGVYKNNKTYSNSRETHVHLTQASTFSTGWYQPVLKVPN